MYVCLRVIIFKFGWHLIVSYCNYVFVYVYVYVLFRCVKNCCPSQIKIKTMLMFMEFVVLKDPVLKYIFMKMIGTIKFNKFL